MIHTYWQCAYTSSDELHVIQFFLKVLVYLRTGQLGRFRVLGSCLPCLPLRLALVMMAPSFTCSDLAKPATLVSCCETMTTDKPVSFKQ